MGKVAFIFSGQGAQYAGMGKELFEASPAARAIFDMADKVRPGTSKQCFKGTKEELSMTINTQPCVFAMDLACAAALTEAGVVPDGAAGFSLGEIAGLAFCGMLSYEKAFSLVCRRSEMMNLCAQQKKGAMLAILRLDNEKIEELCQTVGTVYPVNYNCNGQLVAAGEQDGIRELARLVSQSGGKSMALAVSGAFHSPLMEAAADALEKELENYDLISPVLPLYSNVTAKPYGQNAKQLLVQQVRSPVLWQKTIENMISDGFDTFIEVGPGKTLSGLIKKISATVRVVNVENSESLAAAIHIILGGSHA